MCLLGVRAFPAGAPQLSALEFSETSEFCKAVRTKDEHDAPSDLPSAQFKLARQGNDGAADGDVSMAPAGGGGGASTSSAAVKQEPKSKEEGDDDDDDDDGGDDDDEAEEANGAAFLYERKASGGLGAVLDIARNRGMLGEEKELAGRMFDQKGAGLHAYTTEASEKEATFSIDHYDEYGRKMTQKQAFRQLSWKFHGKAPSKRNREKRLLEVEKQLAEKGEDKAMAYMSALQAAQQSTKSAHVVLTGIHAIKPTEVKAVRQQVAGGAGAGASGERPKKKAKAAL